MNRPAARLNAGTTNSKAPQLMTAPPIPQPCLNTHSFADERRTHAELGADLPQRQSLLLHPAHLEHIQISSWPPECLTLAQDSSQSGFSAFADRNALLFCQC